jgi:TonB-dependent starch-binding outer membrane protein SusC
MKKLILYLFIMCFGLIANAQTITGVVSGAEDGSPLPGVGVQLKGTATATITDLNGAYTINVTGAESVLVFSFVGYKTQEIAVGTQTKIDVKLAVSEEVTEEVVVVGYGTKKKSLVTGAITTVGSEDIKSSLSRAEEAMQGKSAGVMVTANSGSPGV